MSNMTNLQHLMNALKRAKTEHMLIVKNGQQGNENYVVINDDKAYDVSVENGQITKCTCPHNEHRNVVCKHMIKLSMIYSLNISSLYTNLLPKDEKEAG